MKDFLLQIRGALKVDLYYLSLFATLAIPDICGALDSADGIATPSKYKTWFDEQLRKEYGESFSGEDCYRFRCSLLHQGTTQHPKSKYARIIFVEPSPATANLVLHRNVFNDVFNIDVRIFCEDMVGAALRWLSEVEGTERFSRNQQKFMRRYPEGIAPFIRGVPVIG